MGPDGIGGRLPILRQPFVAAAGGDHRKAGGPRPIDQFAGEPRLIAIGQAVDHAGLGGLVRQQRPAERIRLHRDVDDMLAVAERRQRVLHRRGRISRAFDDDLDFRMRHQRLPVVADMRRFRLHGVVERGRRKALRRPIDAGEIGPCIGRRKIGDPDQMNARRTRHLRQIHRSEFAGADQAYPERPAGCLALAQLAEKIHLMSPAGKSKSKSASRDYIRQRPRVPMMQRNMSPSESRLLHHARRAAVLAFTLLALQGVRRDAGVGRPEGDCRRDKALGRRRRSGKATGQETARNAAIATARIRKP